MVSGESSQAILKTQYARIQKGCGFILFPLLKFLLFELELRSANAGRFSAVIVAVGQRSRGVFSSLQDPVYSRSDVKVANITIWVIGQQWRSSPGH